MPLAIAAACLAAGVLSRAVHPRTSGLLSTLQVAPLQYNPDRLTPPGLLTPQSTAVPAPVVDLGYAQYAGYFNATFHMNIYRGCVRACVRACEGVAAVPWLLRHVD